MSDEAQLPRRRRTRLKYYDYSSPGAYFVTFCTRDKECLLRDVHDGIVRLGPAGKIVSAAWSALSRRFPDIQTDAFVVMPNHIHGIIINVGVGSSYGG